MNIPPIPFKGKVVAHVKLFCTQPRNAMPVGIKPRIPLYHILYKVGSRMSNILFTMSGTKVSPGLPSFHHIRGMTKVFNIGSMA